MKSRGVTVRPIRLIDGAPPGRHEVNQVFFDDVRVPVENLVGTENAGWTYARYLLSNERTGSARVGIAKERLRHLKWLARCDGPRPALADPLSRPGHRARGRAQGARDHDAAGPERRSAPRHAPAEPALVLLKLRGTEIQQKVSGSISIWPARRPAPCVGRRQGPTLARFAPRAGSTYFNWRSCRSSVDQTRSSATSWLATSSRL